MSADVIHLFAIASLAVLAGVVGFLVGGMIEMKKHHREMVKRHECEELRKQADKNSSHSMMAA